METPFTKMFRAAMKVYEKAPINFKNGNHKNTIATYRWWVKKVAMARLACENDVQKQKQFLATLYKNAAVCNIN